MLRHHAREAFDSALARAGDHEELAVLRSVLAAARAHLDEPMRVALVGHIKAGKSTLVNALLGEDVAPTGQEELTFNVNWLRHAERPGLVVHFKDGRPPEERAPAEFADLVCRTSSDQGLLRSIRHVELRRPAELLRRFEICDTPGLGSFFDEDSANTMRSLGLGVDDIEGSTRRESALADALLCLFSRGLAAADQSVVADFQGPLLGEATPITTIGVLTKVDAYWDPSEPGEEPLAVGRHVAGAVMREPRADRVFFTVVPVCGLMGFGAQTLTRADREALDALAALPSVLLARRLAFAERFAGRDYDDVPVAPSARAELLRRLGQYGIWAACSLLRDGACDAELREELLRRSGVTALRELLLSHFGHRALLIKAEQGLRKGRAAAFPVRQRLDGPAAAAAGAAAGVLEQLERGEPAFDELALLKRYYAEPGSLGLIDGEGDELLRITGEHGANLGPRLGLPALADPGEMERVATERLQRWRGRGNGFGSDPRAATTARVMAGAYERFLFHAREARRHLELEG